MLEEVNRTFACSRLEEKRSCGQHFLADRVLAIEEQNSPLNMYWGDRGRCHQVPFFLFEIPLDEQAISILCFYNLTFSRLLVQSNSVLAEPPKSQTLPNTLDHDMPMGHGLFDIDDCISP